jgi:hypothetical protein
VLRPSYDPSRFTSSLSLVNYLGLIKRQCDRLSLHFFRAGNAECFENVSQSFFCF